MQKCLCKPTFLYSFLVLFSFCILRNGLKCWCHFSAWNEWFMNNVEIPILWILDIVSLVFQVLSRLTSSHHVVFLGEGGGACAAFQQPRDKPRSQVCDPDAGQEHMWVQHKHTHTEWCVFLSFYIFIFLSALCVDTLPYLCFQKKLSFYVNTWIPDISL